MRDTKRGVRSQPPHKRNIKGGEFMRTYGKLKERIKKVFGTQGAFAKAMGMDKSTANQKLNGHSRWKDDELYKISAIFGIELNEIAD